MNSSTTKQLKILISAGETSGDEHGAHLLSALNDLNITTHAFGMCGEALEKAGAKKIIDASSIGAVMGFGEVFLKLFKIKKALSTLTSALKKTKPDVLVIIDFPDFNLRLAKEAHRLNIPVFYFIPPKIWAWRSGRAKQLEQYITRAAYIFPHEKSAAQRLGFTKGEFVGHPYSADNSMRPASIAEKRAIKKSFGIPESDKLLAIFPGSRRGELRRHSPALVDAIKSLLDKHSDLSIAIAQAPGLKDDALSTLSSLQGERVKIIPDAQHQIFKAADAGLIKSGTSTLQAAFYGFPFTMFFKAPLITGWIVKNFVKLKEFSLVNIIAPKTVREMLQDEVQGASLAQEAERLLYEETYINSILEKLLEMRLKLTGASIQAESAYTKAAKSLLSIV